MFKQKMTAPVAVTTDDEESVDEGIRWLIGQLGAGQRLTVWTPQMQNLTGNSQLRSLVARAGVEHITGRGGAHLAGPGPVLMAWPHPTDISEFLWYNSYQVTALCVIAWGEDELLSWVSAARPELLGKTTSWDMGDQLDPVVEAAMLNVTESINHNNTITGGYEKDDVVSALLALHDAGYTLDAKALEGWAVANGWSGHNPARLAEYARKIMSGSRPRSKRKRDTNFVERMRQETSSSMQQDR
ncbi:hypothetical protein [Actinomyces oris]|uniref:hypothetical protein n=1 Tax=Actinomyces oris TaxID=544580 RepID=UPI002852A346|nr:hypothetical protein [Actinomyces oris]